jgi:hypothetical protein
VNSPNYESNSTASAACGKGAEANKPVNRRPDDFTNRTVDGAFSVDRRKDVWHRGQVEQGDDPMSRRSSYTTRTIAPLALVLLVVCPGTLWANAAPPFRQGDLVTEPKPFRPGDLAVEPNGARDIVIQREALTMDMRPLADGRTVHVEAVYQLHTDRAIDKLELVFVTGSATTTVFNVSLDGQKLPSSQTPIKDPQKEFPARWQAPATTPGLNGGPLQYATPTPNSLWSFQLTLTPGEHTLQVRYDAVAASYRSSSPTLYWQLAYVLSPAREWGGFGGLDVTVQLPPGWHAASQPALTRDGDTLRGSFDDLPADSIAFTAQYPPPSSVSTLPERDFTLVYCTLAGGFVVCLLGGALLGLMFGRKRFRSSMAALPVAVGLGLLWTVGLTVSFYVTMATPRGLPPEISAIPANQRTSGGDSGIGVLIVLVIYCLLSLLAIPVGMVLTQLAAVVTRRLTLRPVVLEAVPDEEADRRWQDHR